MMHRTEDGLRHLSLDTLLLLTTHGLKVPASLLEQGRETSLNGA